MRIFALSIEMVNALRSWFHPKDRNLYLADDQYIISRKVAWQTAHTLFSTMPGRLGFWSMGDPNRQNANAFDNSPQARLMTSNGAPTYGIYRNVVPFVIFNGTTDYLSRADEAALDITGADTTFIPGVRGATMGGWYWFNTLAGGVSRGLIGKFTTTGAQRSYTLLQSSVNAALFAVSSNGAAESLVSGSGLNTGRWYFIVGRYVPGTSLDVYVGSPGVEAPDDWVKTSNTTSIPASIFASTTALEIGRFNLANANIMAGRASFVFLSANALHDDTIKMLFEQSKILYEAE